MRLILLLTSLLMLAACTQTDANAGRVFQNAFATTAQPTDVVPLNGYRMERRKWFALKQMWRLHLAGPGARKLVHQRWPDLQSRLCRKSLRPRIRRL